MITNSVINLWIFSKLLQKRNIFLLFALISYLLSFFLTNFDVFITILLLHPNKKTDLLSLITFEDQLYFIRINFSLIICTLFSLCFLVLNHVLHILVLFFCSIYRANPKICRRILHPS